MPSLKNAVTHRMSSRGIDPLALFGQHDSCLRTIESEFDAKIIVRGEDVIITGEEAEVQQAASTLRQLMR